MSDQALSPAGRRSWLVALWRVLLTVALLVLWFDRLRAGETRSLRTGIATQELLIVDDDDIPRARLALDEEQQPFLVFYDDQQRPSADLRTIRTEGHPAEGRLPATEPQRGVAFRLFDGQGQAAVGMAAAPSISMVLFYRDAKPEAILYSQAGATGLLLGNRGDGSRALNAPLPENWQMSLGISKLFDGPYCRIGQGDNSWTVTLPEIGQPQLKRVP